MQAAQKILLFLLFSFLFSLFASFPVLAQTKDPYTTPLANSDVPQNLHTFTQSVMIEISSALVCQLIGIDPISPSQKCLGIDPQTRKIGYVENGGGLIGLAGQGIAMLYTPPISSTDYVRYLAGNFGIAKSANAQSFGSGFNSIRPLLSIWTTFRNIVYILFLIVFVLIGVAIMLRIKIDPRTVMSVENQIPKIIVALLLVTFSFAIAGLLIDVMWIFIYLSISIISPKDLATLSLSSNTFGFANSLFQPDGNTPTFGMGNNIGIWIIVLKPAQMIADIVTRSTQGFFSIAVGNLSAGALAATGVKLAISRLATMAFMAPLAIFLIPKVACNVPLLSLPIRNSDACRIINNSEALTLGFIAGLIAFLVISIAVLWALARLWFALLNAYIFIILDIVLAPFWILSGLAPGSTWGFGGWIKDMLANLSAFPTAIVLFLLGKRFMEEMGSIPQGSTQFNPPLLGATSPQGALGVFVGLGVILLTPTVVQMMRELFKAPQFKYTAAIGQAIGYGVGAQQRLIQNGLGLVFAPQYDKTKGVLVYPHGALGRALRVLGLVK